MTEKTTINLELPATHRYLNVLGACLGAVLDRVEQIDDREMFLYNMELALHETCTNIVEHAYKRSSDGRIQIAMNLHEQSEQRRLVIELTDEGDSFALDEAAEPNLEEAQVHGYGLFIMRQLLDEVSYTPQSSGNRWRLVKNF